MDNKEKNKPDFLIIGSMKSGTTTLYSDLSRLNALYLPSKKEPAILAKFSAQDDIKSEYLRHFKGSDENQLCGEASTVYTKIPRYKGIVDRAYKLCGKQLRLIMVMRDPVERIYSHLRHDVAGGLINVDEIDNVVLEDTKYIDVSNYAMQLKPWIDVFGSNNLYCVSFIEFRSDREKVIQDIASFLGVDTDGYKLEKEIRNKSTELRLTGEKIKYAINTGFYRNFIRPVLSDKMRELVRSLLLPRVEVPDIKLSASVEQEVKNKLINVENEIQALTGKRIRVNAIDS